MTDMPLPLPRLNVPLAPREKPVELVELHVSAEVSGALAVTTWEFVFVNPNQRVLEGQLEFPLLDGQTVVRFAMDVNGSLREAVPVAKDKGRQVFEEIVRRGVDPGLLEKTAGNNYKARVYPLLPNQRKRVVIAYQEELAGPSYRLALAFAAPIKRFSLQLAARGPAVAPTIARDSLGLSLPPWRQDHVTRVEKADFKAQGVLELSLPPGDRPALTTQELAGKTYFRAEQALALRSRPRPTPRVIGLLWDCSGSADARDLKREYAALDAYLRALPGPLELRLVRLRDTAEPVEVFRVENGDWSALRRAIDRTLYDGASSLAGVAPDPAVDAWLLVSDGLFNFGAPETRIDTGRAPLHVLVAAAKSDPARLRDLAARSGGEYVDLLDLSPETATRRLLHHSERLLELDTSPREVAQVFPEAPAPLSGDRLVLTGILRGEQATVRARLGFPDDPASQRDVEVSVRADEHRGQLAARAWAAAKIAALEPLHARNQADIERTGQDFGIVTRSTSLIILDAVEDYARHDITPPEELRPAWEQLRRSQWQQRESSRQARVEHLARLFRDYVGWYETVFHNDPPKPPLRPDSAPQGQVRYTGHGSPPMPEIYDADIDDLHNDGESAPAAEARDLGGEHLGASEERSAIVQDIVSAEPMPAAPSAPMPAAPARAARPSSPIVGAPMPASAPPSAAPMASAPMSASAPPSPRPAPAPAASLRARAPEMDSMELERGISTGKREESGPAGATIQLQKWSPDAPYLDRLRRAAPDRLYHVYHEERPDYARSTAFFLDVADVFFDRNEPALALRVLSNLAEMELENPAILRILGYRLLQAGRPDLARPVFEQVKQLRSEEPQSLRDLAQACAALGDVQAAVDLLWEVAVGQWDARFPEIELIALIELNALLATAFSPVDAGKIDPRLRRAMPLDLRVVLTWDADNTDIDLWVTDPSGERAYYGNRRTRQGGRMSPDFRQGYGPEEFSLRRAMPGEYLVEANFYGNSQQIIAGATTIQLQFVTGFATREARDQRVTLRLRDTREVVSVGRFTVGR